MGKISNEAVDLHFSELSNSWRNLNYIQISKSFEFTNFAEVLEFIFQVAEFAMKLDHYPEITFSDSEAKILLPKNAELNEVDFKLAKKIDNLKIDIESKDIANNIEILKNSNDFEKRKAAGRLGNIGDIRAVNSLINSLKDKDPFVRRHSAVSLGKIGSPKAIYPLALLLSHDKDGLSYSARDALINIGKPSIPELMIRAKNTNVITRRRAIRALGEIGDRKSISTIKDALLDKDEGVRWRAAKYVNISWDAEVVEILKKLEKKDNSKKVRNESSETLKLIEKEVKELIPLFERGMKAISDEITTKINENNLTFSNNERNFLSLHTYNPYLNRIYLFRDSSKIEGVKAMKGDPKWGIITFQNKNELHTALEAAKESFIIMEKITNSR